MVNHTPRLDGIGKRDYLKVHLYNELRWLLCAATEWAVQEQLNLRKVGYDVQVYAMDSACLHARALFEFFVKTTNDNHYGADVFIGNILSSCSYTNDWSGPLHSYLIHAQDRSGPAPLKTSSGMKDLNKMPVEFAREILGLWTEFEAALGRINDPEHQELQKIACEKRKEAVECAVFVVGSCVAERHAKEKGQVLRPVFVFSWR